MPLSLFIVGHGYGPNRRLHHKALITVASFVASLEIEKNEDDPIPRLNANTEEGVLPAYMQSWLIMYAHT